MENEKKIGRAVNIFCAILDLLLFMIRVCCNGEMPRTEKDLLVILLLIIGAALIVADVKKRKRPRLIKIVIIFAYLLLCVLSLVINGSNSMFFVLIMISTGLVALLFERKMLRLYCISGIVLSVAGIFAPCIGIKDMYDPVDYLLSILCLLVEDVILLNIQRILFERDDEKQENNRTVDELLRVVDAKREEAMAATKSKSDFLANMSHEIRTPINAVLGLNEMILRESSDQSTIEYAQDIRSAGNSLLALVNDILDFSKIEAGKMEIHPVEYNLGSMLNDLINIISMRALDKQLSFDMDIDPTLPTILVGDEVRIRQIITNLLTNAVKYTSEGTVELVVAYRKLGDFQIELQIRVTDTGQGMKPEDLKKLYAPFERIEEVKNRHVEGTGLGMALTRNLLNMMGSDIQVESVYGEGSVFSFCLKQDVSNWECIGSLDEALKRVKEQDTEKQEYFCAPDAHILVVDDMPLNLKVFKSLLKRTKVQIEAVASGAEALSLVRENKYDIIFLDHMMPEMDGIETLHRMDTDRFNINRRVTPVVVLTANAVSGAREMYMAEGFADYLTKPVDSGMLEAMCIKYLDPALVTMCSGSDEPEAEAFAENSTLAEVAAVPGIDAAAGVATSGDEGMYLDIVRDFCSTIDTYSDVIEKYHTEGDIRNYTIQVHALKSSSRLLGAMELSGLAASLEKAGNDGNEDFINENTDRLLQMYRGLKAPLSEACGLNKPAEEPQEDIDEGMLDEALEAIREGAEMLDFDLIESVMKDISVYRMPEDFKEDFEELKVMVARVDSEKITEILGRRLDNR